MKLSDIMSQMGLASYAEAGLLIFFLTFIGIAVYVYRTPSAEAAKCSRIPLSDEPVSPRGERDLERTDD